MKIKQQPEDFQVEELTQRQATDQGPFGFYRLEKSGWTTPDAVLVIRRRWRLEPRRFSCGGLKDRHGQTVQYLTIHHGPQRNLTHQRLKLTYLGQVAEPYTSRDVQANRFRLVLRSLTDEQTACSGAALAEVGRDGVPNYYDDQRFGSVSGGGFVARALILGRYEEALRLALAAPYEYDRAAQKKEKGILRTHWGGWTTCRDLLPPGHCRKLADYLAHHPDDYRGAVLRLRPELRTLYLSAYQSHLWNRLLARWLQEHLRPAQMFTVKLRLGPVPMHRRLDQPQRQELVDLLLPLPSARLVLEESDPRQILLTEVLREEGLQPEQFKMKELGELFFSKGERAALCLPTHLTSAAAADEKHAGKQKLVLAFELPRGSYATLLVKRLAAQERIKDQG